MSESTKSRKGLWIFGSIMFIGGVIFYGVFGVVLTATNQTEFCTSCHSMKINLEEMKENPHYNNASGVTVGCADCHVPRSLGPKLWAKLMAAKDVYHEIIGTIDTPEKFEEHRWRMANQVWDKMRASDSRECRECHSFEHMDFDEQDRSASKQHSRVKSAIEQVSSLDDQEKKKLIEEIAAQDDAASSKKHEMKDALENGDKTCIDCHKGIAHTEPEPPEEDEEDEE